MSGALDLGTNTENISKTPGSFVLLLQAIQQTQFMVMPYPRLTYWFKKWLDTTGIPCKAFTMHSFRQGVQLFCTRPISLHKLSKYWVIGQVMHT